MLKPLDLDRIAEGLAAWLRRKLPDAHNLCVSNLLRPSLGLSNDTALFDLDWSDARGEHHQRLVARLLPTERLVFPEYDLARQYRVMEALEGSGVPVPHMRWFEADPTVFGQQFFVMDACEGEAPSDVPPYHTPVGMCFDASPAERAKMWWNGIEVLARIHAVDWHARGLAFLGDAWSPRAAMDAQLDYWADYFEWARTAERQPILDHSLQWLRRNRPTPARTALCWGDSRLGNMLFKDFEVTAVLDWEMAFLGDPEADLAWWLFLDWNHSEGYQIPRLEGFPTREETVARYQKLCGRRVENLFYYDVFAAFRFGAIMARVATIMRESGLPMPTEDFASNNPCTRRLSDLLELPAPGQHG
jgi:aminoglycoside phosphotransferase (APT) family kinase protein